MNTVVGHEVGNDGVYYLYVWVKDDNIDVKIRVDDPEYLVTRLQDVNNYIYGKNHKWPGWDKA
jgi:hypothetical protein